MQILPACIIGGGPFVPNAVGQSPYLSPGTHHPHWFFFCFQATAVHTNIKTLRDAEKTLTSLCVFNISFMFSLCCFPSQMPPCYESGGYCNQAYILSEAQWAFILPGSNKEWLCQSWRCMQITKHVLIVLIKESKCVYVQYTCVSAETSSSIFMCFPICDPPL